MPTGLDNPLLQAAMILQVLAFVGAVALGWYGRRMRLAEMVSFGAVLGLFAHVVGRLTFVTAGGGWAGALYFPVCGAGATLFGRAAARKMGRK